MIKYQDFINAFNETNVYKNIKDQMVPKKHLLLQ